MLKVWLAIKSFFIKVWTWIKKAALVVVPFVKKYWKQILIGLSVLLAFIFGVKITSTIKDVKAKKAAEKAAKDVKNAELESAELKKKTAEAKAKADAAKKKAKETVEDAETTKKESQETRKTVADAMAKRKKKAAELKDKVLPFILIVILLFVGTSNVMATDPIPSPSYEKLMESYLEAVDLADEYKTLYEAAESDNELLLVQLEKNEAAITALQTEVTSLAAMVDELNALMAEKDAALADTNNTIKQMQVTLVTLEKGNTLLLDKINTLLKKDKYSFALGVEGSGMFNVSTASTSALTLTLVPQVSLYAQFEYRF